MHALLYFTPGLNTNVKSARVVFMCSPCNNQSFSSLAFLACFRKRCGGNQCSKIIFLQVTIKRQPTPTLKRSRQISHDPQPNAATRTRVRKRLLRQSVRACRWRIKGKPTLNPLLGVMKKIPDFSDSPRSPSRTSEPEEASHNTLLAHSLTYACHPVSPSPFRDASRL